ncbi:hypothetical protein ACH4FA_29105 [Streptomyces sp. NPDC017966]|uniref:hypothetical protein n=1 Tax=unclassified Streptomyces TaxID=2593676 RepID=UPI0034571B30
MASSSPPSADRDEGTPPLRWPFAERAHARAAGLDEALPQWADGLGSPTGSPSPHRSPGCCRDPRDRRCAGPALRGRT